MSRKMVAPPSGDCLHGPALLNHDEAGLARDLQDLERGLEAKPREGILQGQRPRGCGGPALARARRGREEDAARERRTAHPAEGNGP